MAKNGRSFDRRIWILFWSRMIDGAGYSIVSPFLALYMAEDLGTPMTLVGAVLLVAGVAGAVGSLAGGIAADAKGRRRVMVATMLLRCLTFVVLALVVGYLPDLVLIAAVLSLNFFLGGAFDPANNAMVADVVEPARHLEAYGLLRVGWNLGFAVGPAVGGILASISFALAFICSALVSFVAGLIILLFLQESHPSRPTKVSKGRIADLRSVSLPFLVFCLICLPMFVMAGQFGTVFPVYSSERLHIESFIIGVVYGLNGLMVAVLQLPLARALAPHDMFASMFFGALLYVMGFFCLAFVGDGWGLALCMVIITVGEMVVTPVSTSLTAAYSHLEDRGRYMGVFGLIASLGWFSSSIVGGVVYDNVHDGVLLWGLLSMWGALTAVGMIFLWRGSRRRALAGTQVH
jgi:MFS family permease